MTLDPAALGSADFRRDHDVDYAYVAGAMFKGIASVPLVAAMARARLLAYFGSGGLTLSALESAIASLRREVPAGRSFGMNLLCNRDQPDFELKTAELFVGQGVRRIEAAAFSQVTPALVWYRLKGSGFEGQAPMTPNRVLAKVSRPEVATAFMSPAPEPLVARLVDAGRLSRLEAEVARHLPMADDVCVEADSGGHTDAGVQLVLLPAMLLLRDEMMQRFRYPRAIRVGAAGGIGTPHAAAAAFLMGADFILTGSINQATVEAGTSDSVKDLLQGMNVQDTTYAPAGDMFEQGARVQVLRKGVFFPSRANKLYELYQRFESLEAIDEATRRQIEEKYFGRTCAAVWDETRAFYQARDPQRLAQAERSPRQKMALIFRWYFVHSTRLALEGREEQRVDYQVHCGPALGAFNQWVKGTPLESWRNRQVADVAGRIMRGTAALIGQRTAAWYGADGVRPALATRAEAIGAASLAI